ncbi:MAG: ribonuclease P protein component [Bacteroidales bacterium]|nr:ribonuclease P protein component [Bacteroidales bacterium]
MDKMLEINSVRNTFKKYERLNSRKRIDTLFKIGKRIRGKKITLVYSFDERDDNIPCKVFVNAPKRNFKRAVDRNFLKRQLRELYRLHKQDIYKYLEPGHRTLFLAILYSGKKITSYRELRKEYRSLLRKITYVEMNKKDGCQ